MSRILIMTLLAFPPSTAWSLSRDAKAFMAIATQLEPLHCEKRKLRREIALAMAEQRDAEAWKRKFARLDRDPKTSKLEKRLAQLEPRVSKSSDPEDLAAISLQQREAFYRCE